MLAVCVGIPAFVFAIHGLEKELQAESPPDVRIETREQYEAHAGALFRPMDLAYYSEQFYADETPPAPIGRCRGIPPAARSSDGERTFATDAVATSVFITIRARPNQTVRVESIRRERRWTSPTRGTGRGPLLVCRHGAQFLISPLRKWSLNLDDDEQTYAVFDSDNESAPQVLHVEPGSTEVIQLVASTFERAVYWTARLTLSVAGRVWEYRIGSDDDLLVTVAPDPEKPILVWDFPTKSWREEPWRREALQQIVPK